MRNLKKKGFISLEAVDLTPFWQMWDYYTRNKMNGNLIVVENFLTIHSAPEGLCIYDGNWKSAVYRFRGKSNLKKL